MKALKLLAAAFAATVLFVACNDKKDTQELSAPVITNDMWSVTVDGNTVHFTFAASGDLSPFWKVSAPNGTAVDLGADVRSSDFTKTFEVNGLYSGTLVAFGSAGQSAPVNFTFSIGGSNVDITDPGKSTFWNILVSKTWKLASYGYWGPEWAPEKIKLGLDIPACLADDRLTFKADGTFVLDPGDNATLYDDSATGGIPTFTPASKTGGKWETKKDGSTEYIQFSQGAYPSMLFGEGSVNARYDIDPTTDANQVRIQYQYSEGEFIVLVLVDKDTQTGGGGGGSAELNPDTVRSIITSKSWNFTCVYWFGDEWGDWGSDNAVGDYATYVYTFASDGKFNMDLKGKNVLPNDGNADGFAYTPTGNETWEIKAEGKKVYIQFGGGGVPGYVAGKAKVDSSDPLYNYGVNGKWLVYDATASELKLAILQEWNSQWVGVSLKPAAE